MKGRLISYIELCKPKISAFAALSAFTGGVLAGSGLTGAAGLSFSGVFLLACGAGALNQYQERETDTLMERTGNRVLPLGKIQPAHALFFSMALICSGLFVLSLADNPAVVILGIAAVIWYNGVYTQLKRKSAFAAVPGALTGSISPAIGWTAGGGELSDFRILAICFFFFLWQVPHFWLLLLSYREDYHKTGFPSMNNFFTDRQLSKIVTIWVMATAVTSLMIPLYTVTSNGAVNILMLCAAVWLVFNSFKMISHPEKKNPYSFLFSRINMYMLLVMLILSGDVLLR
jgi:protoheme IX farnesyltransferase